MSEPERLESMRALGVRLRELAEAEESGRTGRRRGKLRIAAAVAVPAVVLGALLTPVGQALQDLAGIGDEPTNFPNGPAVVIGTGEQRSYPYEVVASSPGIEMNGGGPEACIGLDFPSVDGPSVHNCLTDEVVPHLRRDSIHTTVYGAPADLFPDAELIVQGLADPAVEAVTVSYVDVAGEKHAVAASVSELSGELSRRIGVDDETRFFVAFVPTGVLEPPASPGQTLTYANASQALADVRVSATDHSGREIGTKGLGDNPRAAQRLVDFVPPRARFGPPPDPMIAPAPASVDPGAEAISANP